MHTGSRSAKADASPAAGRHSDEVDRRRFAAVAVAETLEGFASPRSGRRLRRVRHQDRRTPEAVAGCFVDQLVLGMKAGPALVRIPSVTTRGGSPFLLMLQGMALPSNVAGDGSPSLLILQGFTAEVGCHHRILNIVCSSGVHPTLTLGSDAAAWCPPELRVASVAVCDSNCELSFCSLTSCVLRSIFWRRCRPPLWAAAHMWLPTR